MRNGALVRVAVGVVALAGAIGGLFLGLGGSRPSLVLITVAGLRDDAITEETTPALAALARAGRRLALMTPAPESVPALAALFTGREPWALGIRHGDLARLPADPPSLAERLHQDGYHTRCWIGEGEVGPLSGLWRGFDRCMFPSSPFTVAATPEEAERISPPSGGAIPAEAIGDLAVAYIRAVQPGTSAFLWLHLGEPAAAARAPDPGARYREALGAVDRAVGKVRSAIATSGLGGTFVLAVASVHGSALGEAGEQGAGLSLADAVFRVPVLVEGISMPPASGPRSLAALGPLLLRGLGFPADLPQGPAVMASFVPGRFYGWPDVAAAGDARGWFRLAPAPEWRPAEGDPVAGEASRTAAPETLVEKLAALGLRGGDAPPAEARAAVLAKVSEARFLAAQGRREEAIGALEAAAARSPVSPAPLLAALQLAREGPEERVERLLAGLRRTRPPEGPHWFDLAQALRAAGRSDEAVALLLRQDPAALGAGERVARARLLAAAGATDAAVSAIDATMAASGEAADLLHWKGDLLLIAGNAYQARQAYERALALPNALMEYERANLLAKLADARDQLGQPEEALQTFARALEVDPGYLYPHARAADILAKLGRVGEAADAAAKSVRRRGDPVQDALAQVQAMRAHGLIGPAIAALRAAVQARPGAPALRVAHAPLLAEAGKVEEARQVLAPYLAGERERADAWVSLARVEALAGDERAALAALAKAEPLAGPRLTELVRGDTTFARFGADSALARKARRFRGERTAPPVRREGVR